MAKFDPRQVAEWTGGSWLHGVPRIIDGISTDSRSIVPGDIFIAICGPRFDGHNFVSVAFAKGATAAIVAHADLAGAGTNPLLVVNDTSQALRRMAANYRQMLGVKIIAVTGSVGKTTVKEMMADILARRQPTAKTIGNWNNEYGLPLSVLSMKPDVKIGVFELGVNHPGELAPLCELLKPDWGIVTTVGPVHLEFFGSEKAVAEEKAVLLKNLPESGTAFLGCDHPWHELLRSAVRGRVVSAGAQSGADYVLLENRNERGEAQVLERGSGELFRFHSPLPGRHIVYDALFAIAVARTEGFAWPLIQAALEAYRPQPMRWEQTSLGGVLVINDAYNANPMSMETALQTFAAMQHGGRKWLVLAGMHELGTMTREAHIKLGVLLAHFEWAGLIAVGRLGGLIADAARNAGMEKKLIFQCADHQAAAETLTASVQPGDAVLLKASRCEQLERVLEIWKQIHA